MDEFDVIRLNVAISMLNNPFVLYFDNALMGLNQIVKSMLLKMLKRINKEFKTTIVIASVDLMDIEKICKRVSVVQNGKIVADGVEYSLGYKDCLYITQGTKEVLFSSNDKDQPAKFYMVSAPAHCAYETKLITIAEAAKRKEMEAYRRSGWSCFPSAAKARLSGIFEKSATRLVGLPIGSSCPKGTKK